MRAFAFVRPRTVEEAAAALAEGGLLKASGIDVLDRMKERVDEPDRVVGLVDVEGLRAIAAVDGRVRIGALATLAEVAVSPHAPASLAKAAGEAASPQLRHRATVGGNLAQHTRCGYYRHRSFACWRRGDDACPVRADGGVQETAGVFGNDACASAHPSSLAPVFGSLDATVFVRGPKGERGVAFADLWSEPRRGNPSDVALGADEIITRVEFAAPGPRVAYEEVRQRAAFDWALVSCAVRLAVGGDAVTDARIWLGAVAPTPRRATAAEKAIIGGPASAARVAAAAKAATQGATPLPGTAYKTRLIEVAVRRALEHAREGTR